MTSSANSIEKLLQSHTLISNQVDVGEVRVILKALAMSIDNNIDGAVVELGCYEGTTSLYISRFLLSANDRREFHVYDSFAGLPDKQREDSSPVGEQFKTGELLASKKRFIEHYKKAGLSLPYIHKGWFEELSTQDIPKKIAFAFLDGDYYRSIKTSLELIAPYLAERATIVIDDYANEALPGAARAVDEWVDGKQYKKRVERSLAILTRQG